MLQKDAIKAENKLLQELLIISINELDSTLRADNKEKNSLRLKRIIKTINGGKNSGNHNPGQGRGVGKPSKSTYQKHLEKYSDFWLNGVGDNGFEKAVKQAADSYKKVVELSEKQKDVEWGNGEYDKLTGEIMDAQDVIEDNFKKLCENNLTESAFYEVKNAFYDWSTNLGPRGKDGLFLSTPDIVRKRNDEAFEFYRAYIQSILHESGITEKKLYRGEPKKFDKKAKEYVSYTDSMLAASNFARGDINNIFIETVPVDKIIAVDDMFRFSGYRTEKEWIVDTGVYE